MSAPLYPVPCPVCGALPDTPCRTRETNRVTDTHMTRIDAAIEARRR